MKILAKPEFAKNRMASGYTVLELSKVVGLSKQAIHQIEGRVNGISPERAKVVTEVLGVEFEDIFELVEKG